MSIKKILSILKFHESLAIEKVDWTIKVFTSDLNGELGEGTDSHVYIYLIGTDESKENSTEKIMLERSNAISNNLDLFESGNVDEFHVTSVDIGKLKKIRIGHSNNEFSGAWHLKKVINLII